MRYGIVGTGALGGFYGGMLANSGADVHFLFRSDYDKVRDNGLRVDSVLGDFTISPAKINAYKTTTGMPECDVVLVCLKTVNNHHLKSLLPPLLGKNTVVIMVQNGLGMEADLAKDFPGMAIAGGMAFICSTKVGDGHIRHADFGELTIGSHTATDPAVLEKVSVDMNNAGIPVRLTDDLNDFRWRKLVWNIPYNGMTVIMDAGTDELMKEPHMRQLINELMLEVIAAGNVCGAHIREDFATKMMDYTDSMRPYKPSMKVDFDAGRMIEIGYIYSNPIRFAAEKGFSMKLTSVMERQLKFLSSKYLSK
jgi:2-dehydropantoate 2-reductase